MSTHDPKYSTILSHLIVSDDVVEALDQAVSTKQGVHS